MLPMSVPVLGGVIDRFVQGKLGVLVEFKQNLVWFRSLMAAVHCLPTDPIVSSLMGLEVESIYGKMTFCSQALKLIAGLIREIRI